MKYLAVCLTFVMCLCNFPFTASEGDLFRNPNCRSVVVTRPYSVARHEALYSVLERSSFRPPKNMLWRSCLESWHCSSLPASSLNSQLGTASRRGLCCLQNRLLCYQLNALLLMLPISFIDSSSS